MSASAHKHQIKPCFI